MALIENATKVGRQERSTDVKVWDILVRLFHWSLVSAYAIAWLTADDWDKLHEYAGYIVGGLIAFRLIWGLIGSRHARFADFVAGPSKVIAYLRAIMQNRAKRYLGHNPAGGAMIIALLLTISVVIITGIAMTSNSWWGVEWVEDLHETAAILTLLLVIAHVVGVILASLAHHENLVVSMITGRKRRQD